MRMLLRATLLQLLLLRLLQLLLLLLLRVPHDSPKPIPQPSGAPPNVLQGLCRGGAQAIDEIACKWWRRFAVDGVCSPPGWRIWRIVVLRRCCILFLLRQGSKERECASGARKGKRETTAAVTAPLHRRRLRALCPAAHLKPPSKRLVFLCH